MKKLGILGGMGPMAGAYFYTRIIANTVAHDDGGHIPVILCGDPRIADRTESILNGDRKACISLLHGVDFLERAGADMIAIPCNTAHAYLDDMRTFTRLPILDMPRLGIAYAVAAGYKRIGVLSTLGCQAAGVYEDAAEEVAATTVVLPKSDALDIQSLIYHQKAGESVQREAYLPYVDMLYDRGADCVILGCTEISCAFGAELTVRQIDPLEILAKTAVALFCEKISEVEVRAFLRTSAV